MTDTLAGDWDISKSKTIGEESYRVHANGRSNPYAYWNKTSAENAAKRLRSLGWSVRIYPTPNRADVFVLYKRKG